MHRLSQFPSPYPDECYYSILCRYYQRMGYFSFDKAMISLFGKPHHTDMFILMPYLASYVNNWVDPCLKINAETITSQHTAFYYCILADWEYNPPKKVLKKMWNGTMKIHPGFASVKKEKLCYCPECAEEERKKYGEPYWHRLHQIRGITVCSKHETRIVESEITFEQTKRAFFPASSIITGHREADASPSDSNRLIRLFSDIEWILNNGKKLSNKGRVAALLKRYFAKKNIEINKHGFVKNADIELAGFEEFHLIRHPGDIFSDAYISQVLKSESTPLWTFYFFKPLDLVMLMEYLEGSVEKFFKCI